MGGMVWSAKESWYGLVTLIEVGYDPLSGVYMLRLTRIRLVVAEIWAVLANEPKFGPTRYPAYRSIHWAVFRLR